MNLWRRKVNMMMEGYGREGRNHSERLQHRGTDCHGVLKAHPLPTKMSSHIRTLAIIGSHPSLSSQLRLNHVCSTLQFAHLQSKCLLFKFHLVRRCFPKSAVFQKGNPILLNRVVRSKWASIGDTVGGVRGEYAVLERLLEFGIVLHCL